MNLRANTTSWIIDFWIFWKPAIMNKSILPIVGGYCNNSELQNCIFISSKLYQMANNRDRGFVGFLGEHFGTDHEIIESRLTGRAYLLRRRRGMPCIGGIGIIVMGCLLIFVFAPQSGDSTFAMIGVVLIIIGAISITGFMAWLYYKYKNRDEDDMNAPMVQANPVYANAVLA